MNNSIATFLEKISMYYSFNSETKAKAIAFNKASDQIKSLDFELSNSDLKKIKIKGIGASITQELEEFFLTGTSQRLVELEKQYKDHKKVLDNFMKIYGIGPIKASVFYNEGLRTYSELKKAGYLTEEQLMFLEHINDISRKIPREEIEDIEAYFKSFLSFEFTFAGSYRRGKSKSSDYDMIVPLRKSISMKKIIKELDQYICIKLNNGIKVFHGVISYMYGDQIKYRRIDISIVPVKTYPCFLLHATGPKQLNIAMSLHAISKGFTLNKYELIKHYKNKDTTVVVKSEEDIFKALGLKWISPENRTEKFKLIEVE